MPKVDQFAPQLIALWRGAVKERIEVRVPSRAKAIHLRQRLYILRRQMEREEHPLALSARGVQLSISPVDPEHEDGETWLVARPADEEYLNYIAESGVDLETPLPDHQSPQEDTRTEMPTAELPGALRQWLEEEGNGG